MVKLPTQKRYAILPIVAGSILWTIFVVMPILNYLQSLVDFYEPILNETTPTIHLYDGRIEFQGSIPQKITLANDVEVFFDSTFNDSAFQQSPVRSVFISSQTIHVKTKNETKTYSLDDIEVDSEPLVLEPLQVKEILRKYRDIAFVIISITGFFAVLVACTLIALFGAGIGIMVDAFSSGPFQFGALLNLSSLFLLAASLVWIIFGFESFADFKTVVIFYFIIFITFVYLTILLRRIKT